MACDCPPMTGPARLGGPRSEAPITLPLPSHGPRRSPVTPDGCFLISASKDGSPQLRNGETGDWIGTFHGHKGAVWSAVLNDTAYIAATGSADFTARIWNAVTGAELYSFPHKHIVRTVAFSTGQQECKLATGGACALGRAGSFLFFLSSHFFSFLGGGREGRR